MNDELVFSLDEWIRRFPLTDDIRSGLGYKLDDIVSITSPFDIAIIEQLRRDYPERTDMGRPVPTDLFIFGRGEPPVRHITKIGGAPYRPANLLWPVTQPMTQHQLMRGETQPPERPMTFLAQLYFGNSSDIVGDLPGDILLVFAENDEFSRPESLSFEWHSVGVADIIPISEVPAPAWDFVTCFGFRHRTADWPDAISIVDDSRAVNAHVAVLGGTKVGGVPSLKISVSNRGRFLGQVAHICPRFDAPYPWVNQPSAIALNAVQDIDQLLLVDAGIICIFLDDDQRITWEFQCA